MDALTKNYRIAEFKSLDHATSEYKPSLKIWDGKGNSTKTIAITEGELKAIEMILTYKE